MEPPIQPGETWNLFVIGEPRPQGSKRARAIYRKDPLTGRPVPVMKGDRVVTVMSEMAKGLDEWKQVIATMANKEWAPMGLAVLDEPVQVALTFYFQRSASDFKKDGSLRDGALLYPATKGADLDKLARGVYDALTGIVFKDDRRVVTAPLRRRYGPQDGVEISVRRYRATTIADLRALRESDPAYADELAQQLELQLEPAA